MNSNSQVLDLEKLEFKMFTMDQRALELESARKDIIRLSIGIPEIPLSKEVVETLAKANADFATTHRVDPEGIVELRSAIADHYNNRIDHKVFQANSVLVSTGTSTIFRNLCSYFAQYGSRILLPRPYYCLYLVSSLLAGLKIDFYDIDLETGGIDFEQFDSAYDKVSTVAVVVNSPGNPLGNVLDDDDLRNLQARIGVNTTVIFDEIYDTIFFGDNKRMSTEKFFPFSAGNVIYTNGFSKVYGMYTKRVGYCLAPERIWTWLRIVQQHTLLTADPANQIAALKALSDDRYPRRIRETYEERARMACSIFDNAGVRYFRPEGGFYLTVLLPNDGDDLSVKVASDLLEATGVAVVPGADFGLPNSLRLSFCNARFGEGVERISDFILGNVGE